MQVVQYQCMLYVDLYSHVCTFNSAKVVTLLLKYVGFTVRKEVHIYSQQKEKKQKQEISAAILYSFQKAVLVHQ